MHRYEIRQQSKTFRPEDRGQIISYAETWPEAVATRDAHPGAYISVIQPEAAAALFREEVMTRPTKRQSR